MKDYSTPGPVKPTCTGLDKVACPFASGKSNLRFIQPMERPFSSLSRGIQYHPANKKGNDGTGLHGRCLFESKVLIKVNIGRGKTGHEDWEFLQSILASNKFKDCTGQRGRRFFKTCNFTNGHTWLGSIGVGDLALSISSLATAFLSSGIP